jgi:hypothetical protein
VCCPPLNDKLIQPRASPQRVDNFFSKEVTHIVSSRAPATNNKENAPSPVKKTSSSRLSRAAAAPPRSPKRFESFGNPKLQM